MTSYKDGSEISERWGRCMNIKICLIGFLSALGLLIIGAIIGNLFLVKFFQSHEQAIVYSCWIMMIIGFGIIFFLGKDGILEDLQ
jgi:hypothetical protein